MIAIDGDTIADGAERLRLVGFNAPELHSPACIYEWILALQAKRRIEAWLAKRPVLIRVGRDRYGRTLAIGQPDPGPALISEGLAEPYKCRDGHCPRRKNWCREAPLGGWFR